MASIGYSRDWGEGRGRKAAAPQQIPARGWKDVLLRTFGEVNNDRVTLIAAGATYFLLLAIFPAVTAFVSIYGLFADPGTVVRQLSALENVVPAGGLDILRDQLVRVTSQGAPTLGLALVISLAIALWSASSGVGSMFQAMNVAYDEPERRNFFVLTGLTLLFTLLGIIAAAVMLGAVVAIPVVLGFVGLSEGLGWLVRIAGYVVMLLVLLTGIAVLYRFGPSRSQAKWRWITPGAVLAVIVIGIVSALFSWYAANIGHFDQTYGSLGALIGFMFWMWVSITAIIVGAELNAEMERQTARDSTVGRPHPMGQRHAAVADTLGSATDRDEPDDPRAGKSAEWVAGFEEARRLGPSTPRPAPRRLLPIAYAVPAAIALALVGRRMGRR